MDREIQGSLECNNCQNHGKLVSLECQHQVCLSCLSSILAPFMDEKNEPTYFPRCPIYPNCDNPVITHAFLGNFMPSSVVGKLIELENRTTDWYIESRKKAKYDVSMNTCPSCTAQALPDEEIGTLQCFECNHVFCLKCGLDYHGNECDVTLSRSEGLKSSAITTDSKNDGIEDVLTEGQQKERFSANIESNSNLQADRCQTHC